MFKKSPEQQTPEASYVEMLLEKMSRGLLVKVQPTAFYNQPSFHYYFREESPKKGCFPFGSKKTSATREHGSYFVDERGQSCLVDVYRVSPSQDKELRAQHALVEVNFYGSVR